MDNLPMNFAELMASSEQLKYNILRTTPSNDGKVMTHDEIKAVLKLSDGRAEILRASYNLDLNIEDGERK